MVVIRIDCNGNLVDSKPCEKCIATMSSCGIKKVTYSTADGILITEKVKNITARPSLGYRSVERTLQLLDTLLDILSTQ